MFEMLADLHSIISGMICGIIFLQTTVIAPSVFKNLDQSHTRNLLRAIFPKFFLFILLLGFFSLIIGFMNHENFFTKSILSTLTIILSLTCYLIIPATNNAKDNNDQRKFKLLHKISVISTVIILLINLSWVFI